MRRTLRRAHPAWLVVLTSLIGAAGCSAPDASTADPPGLMLAMVYYAQSLDEHHVFDEAGVEGTPVLFAVWSDGLIVRNTWWPRSGVVPIREDTVVGWVSREDLAVLLSGAETLRKDAGVRDGLLAAPPSSTLMALAWRDMPGQPVREAWWWCRPDLAGADPASLLPAVLDPDLYRLADFEADLRAALDEVAITPGPGALATAAERLRDSERFHGAESWMGWLARTEPG